MRQNFTSCFIFPSGLWLTSMSRLVTKQKLKFQSSACQTCWLQICHTSGLLFQILLKLGKHTQTHTHRAKHFLIKTKVQKLGNSDCLDVEGHMAQITTVYDWCGFVCVHMEWCVCAWVVCAYGVVCMHMGVVCVNMEWWYAYGGCVCI